ncbi:hypothetical protein [Pseudonocardia sp. GCM10023141]|uniref:hypothetical protein n=1 Tax=Pseudonocardia sp. GCM10023141 TaxID=3252653 RepID=UPI0036144B77
MSRVNRRPVLCMGRTRTPARPDVVQESLWGTPVAAEQPPPGPAPINDLDLFTSVVKAATEPGYVLIGPAERVFLRDPSIARDMVVAVPRYESDTVSQLLGDGHLAVGGYHQVRTEGYGGWARAVLVPQPTHALLNRWAALHPLG